MNWNCEIFTPLFCFPFHGKNSEQKSDLSKFYEMRQQSKTINIPTESEHLSGSSVCIRTQNCSHFCAREISSVRKTFKNHTYVVHTLQKHSHFQKNFTMKVTYILFLVNLSVIQKGNKGQKASAQSRGLIL